MLDSMFPVDEVAKLSVIYLPKSYKQKGIAAYYICQVTLMSSIHTLIIPLYYLQELPWSKRIGYLALHV